MGLLDEPDVDSKPKNQYTSPDIIANCQPAAIPPTYGRLGLDGIDAVIAMHIMNLGYVIMRTHETLNGPEARLSLFTEGEVSNFED